jgi:hypothetical protein
MLWAGVAAIVVASLQTEDVVAVVAVLDMDILLSVSVSSTGAVVALAEDFLFPKKAAGNEDSRSACLGVIDVEELAVRLS